MGETRANVATRGGTSPRRTSPSREVVQCARALLGLLVLSSLVHCVAVRPYERERLARRDMASARRPELAAGIEHATAYREGSTGALGGSGGGCGCN